MRNTVFFITFITHYFRVVFFLKSFNKLLLITNVLFVAKFSFQLLCFFVFDHSKYYLLYSGFFFLF